MYGGSDRLLSQVIPKTGVVVKLVLLSHTQSFSVIDDCK